MPNENKLPMTEIKPAAVPPPNEAPKLDPSTFAISDEADNIDKQENDTYRVAQIDEKQHAVAIVQQETVGNEQIVVVEDAGKNSVRGSVSEIAPTMAEVVPMVVPILQVDEVESLPREKGPVPVVVAAPVEVPVVEQEEVKETKVEMTTEAQEEVVVSTEEHVDEE